MGDELPIKAQRKILQLERHVFRLERQKAKLEAKYEKREAKLLQRIAELEAEVYKLNHEVVLTPALQESLIRARRAHQARTWDKEFMQQAEPDVPANPVAAPRN